MDGIDGISGVETATIGAGIAAVSGMAGLEGLIPPAAALAGAGLGFLAWNWHPAKVFLGDVGSVPLGFLLGGMLLHLAMDGQLAAALLLPLYYVADATITISRRALKGEKVWQAHRQHFYQRAVQGGRRHDQVALLVLAGGVALIATALLAAAGNPAGGLVMGAAAVALLLHVMSTWAKGKPE
jgi:UDP-N-acetylmuramyl pentapeptide phosphotransferase/UDP-N-acetylglucosamine-1-phosphate transferase